jgi:hypothetical protein
MKTMTLLLITTFFFAFTYEPNQIKLRRIIIKEYPGGTVLPTKSRNEILFAELFDGRYIKTKIYDYRGKMYLWCYSKDSVLLEKGGYINSLALLRTQAVGWGLAGTKNQVIVIEYYEPLRNGKWFFYDSTGQLNDSCFYSKGIKL